MKRKAPENSKSQPTKKYKKSTTQSNSVVTTYTPEVKGIDTAVGTNEIVASYSTNENSYALNLITQGAGSWNRIGRKISLKSVRLRGRVVWKYKQNANATIGLQSNGVRMLLIWDRQPNGGAIPNFNQIFGRTDYAGIGTVQLTDSLLYGQMSRYKVIYDKMYTLNPDVVHGDSATDYIKQKSVWIDKFINLKNLESTYQASTTPPTIADISTGALYLVFRSAVNDANINWVTAGNFSVRLRYIDA